MTTGEKITELRKKHSLSQPQLADKLSVSQSTIAMWESGKRNIGNEDMKRIAKFFKVSVDYLLGITNNSSSNTVDLADDMVIKTFEGKEIPPEDMELIKRLLRGKD